MSIIIAGGGICGLGAALLLARDGHDVTLLERDGGPPAAGPLEAWGNWSRKGVAQFRQPHNFMPGLRRILEAELPDVQDALCRAGASRFDLLNPMPPSLADRSPRPIDDQLWTYTARRPVGEWVFAKAASEEPRVTLRYGVQVAGLMSGTPVVGGVPHVAGIRTTDGEELRADLVVDATGRQSCSPKWLAGIGARPPYEERSDSGFTYYTRYFRGNEPQRQTGALMPIGTISLLTLPGDNGTWSVTVFTASGDQPLKNLRHEEQWTRTVAACPLHAHWLEGEPITGVLPMSGIVDQYRRFVVDGMPVATGFVALADAWACTNPSAGRGLTVGFKHAVCLRDAMRASRGNPGALVEEFHRRTEADIAPWYHSQIAADRARFAAMEALREDRLPPPPEGLAGDIQSLFAGFAVDADLFRMALEYIGTLTPVQQILERPGVRDTIRATVTAMKDIPPPPLPGPNRQQLVDLMR